MLHTNVRLAIAMLFAGIGVMLHVEMGLDVACLLYVTALIVGATHYLFGNVWVAFTKLRKGSVQEAEYLISQVRYPNWLARQPRAYYHFVKGMIALQQKALVEGESYLKESLRLGLRNNTDSALVALNLAHICYVQGRITDANHLLVTAKTYPSDDRVLNEHIQKLERALAYPYN